VSCVETKTFRSGKPDEEHRFVYITNIEQTSDIVVGTADGGRLRWKIENEGFNDQKTKGYELEHKFSRISYTALQNYYQLLQIAHMINQFVENCTQVVDLIKGHSTQTLRALWKDLNAFLKSIPYSHEQLLAFLSD
jgi:hypothetical protein